MIFFGLRCQRLAQRGPKEREPDYQSSTPHAADHAISDYTLQEYLKDNQAILSPNPHAEIARACLAFLSFDDFSNKAPDCWLRWQHRETLPSPQEFACSPYHFTRYAVFSWGDHARRAGEAKVLDATLGFLSRPANVAWLVTMVAERRPVPSKRLLYEELSLRDPDFLKMLLAVKFDLKFVLVELLKTRTKPAEIVLDPVISRLACDATNRCNKEIVRLLLTQKDVDWNMCTVDGENLLMLLAEWNDEDNLRTLLQKKSCSVNTITDKRSALQRAVRKGHTSIARLLLEAGADVEARGNFEPIIIEAIPRILTESGRESMDLLLEFKADMNARCRNGRTVLQRLKIWVICYPKYVERVCYAIEFFVSKGVDPNLPGRDGRTTLDQIELYMKPDDERAAKTAQILRKAGGKRNYPALCETD